MIDFRQALKASRVFYREHNLPAWRAALPVKLTPQGEEHLAQQASQAGCTHAFAFPPFDVQMRALADLIEETARKPAPRLPDNQQYTSSVVLSEGWNDDPSGKVLQRTTNLAGRERGPYFYLFSTVPVQNAWGRTGKQIGELFAVKDWQGLTVPEYFVLQRHFCELRGDHRFYETAEGEAHWLWLIDSMTETACSVALGKARGINIQGCPIGNRDARRAALAGRVVPLL